MSDLVVIFRTHSDIEARIVRGLLETHGIPSLLSSGVAHAVFPLKIGGHWEVRLSVPAGEADEATRVIESYRREVPAGPVVPFGEEFRALEDRLGYRFRDRGLVEHALTHRSRAHEDESGGVIDNESLEFLGDAVLGFVVADLLFREFPGYDEGRKSKIKATIVSTASLARLAETLDLGAHVLLGRGEEKTGGRQKQALLADTLEAIIAAIYVDGGLEEVRRFIEAQIGGLLTEVRRTGSVGILRDYKSALQEWLQAGAKPLPAYRLAGQSGPDHRTTFEIEIWVEGERIATAEGRTKKDAEQQAARLALEHFGVNSAMS